MQLLAVIILCVQSFDWTLTLKKVALRTGDYITIPCHYDMAYMLHKKYWCYHDSAAFNYCTILAYANDTQGKVTLTDNPSQRLFTVTMTDLQTENTGTYWCVVEIGGLTEPDVKEQLYLTVEPDPGVSVLESRVSGEEGDTVSIQCLYSAAYQNKQKQWCRSTDWKCFTVGRTNTSQNSAVQISDDGKTSFMVVLMGLKKSDTGWYWCSVGDLQVPVHLTITGWTTRHRMVTVGLAVPVGLVLLAGVAVWARRRRHTATERNQPEGTERNSGWEKHADQTELLYTSVVFQGGSKEFAHREPETKQSYLPSEDPVTYSTLKKVKR